MDQSGNSMNLRRTKAMARKEFLHIVRDPRSLIMALAVPLLLLLLFGYALRLDVDRIPTLIYDADTTPQSRDLIERFGGSRYFQILGSVDEYKTIERKIDQNECLLAIVIPQDYSRRLLSGEEAEVQLLLDGSDSNTASIALGYATSLLQAYALELRYIVPGLIAVILMIIAALLTSLTIAREWEMGTMEQLLSTPLRPTELVLGKLVAFFGLGLTDMLIALSVGVLIFKVPLRGNGLFLFFTSCVFLFGALCWGLLISASARSQLLAYQMGMLTSFLPAMLLSGFVFALENMPAAIQAISFLVPARYFVTLLKGVFLKGIGLKILWVEVGLLLAYAGIVFLAVTRKLKGKLA